MQKIKVGGFAMTLDDLPDLMVGKKVLSWRTELGGETCAPCRGLCRGREHIATVYASGSVYFYPFNSGPDRVASDWRVDIALDHVCKALGAEIVVAP